MSGYKDCACCGEVIMSDLDDLFAAELCSCCAEAGCEPNRSGAYDDCRIPACPDCQTKATFCTDNKWHSNCDCPTNNGGPQ